MKTINVVIIALVVGAAAFFGGIKFRNYQLSKTRANFANGNFRTGQFNPTGSGQTRQVNGNRFSGGRPVEGEVVSMDDKSITVKMADGSTRIVILADSTTFSKTDSGTKDDIKTGVQVGVFGTENSDGSLTAQNIQLNPMFRLFGGQGTVTPGPSK